MEQRLKEFKSRRRREILLSKPKNFLRAIMDKISPNVSSECIEIQKPLLTEKSTVDESRLLEDDECSILSYVSDDLSISFSSISWLTILTYVLYFALWVVTYLIAIQLEFGYVYLIISCLLFIYFNTRTGPKRKGEISAYSVFNPNCEAIEGSLKAEQFEREFNLIQHKT